MKKFPILLLLSTLFVLVFSGHGQTLDPRLYSNVPKDINFVLSGFSYSEGDVVVDPSVMIDDAEVELTSTFVAYIRTLDMWGKAAKFDVIVPYCHASGSGTQNGVRKERSVDGFADPSFRLSVNFAGSPALSMKDFKDYNQDLILAGSVQVFAPLGQYDSDRLLNIGANRWIIKPELALSKARGPFILELSTAVAFFTDNDDLNNGMTREQDPLGSIQGHIIYTFPRKAWVSLGGTYYGGGRTTVNGEEKSDLQRNSRVGLTLALPLNKDHAIKIFANTGLTRQSGGDFTTGGIAWQYRWGTGL